MNPTRTFLGKSLQNLANSSYYAKRFILLFVDFFILFLSLLIAASLRLESLWPPLWQDYFWIFFVLPITIYPVFISLGLYRAVIRYTSVESLWTIFKASYLSLLLLVGILLIHGFDGFPRSIPLIFFFILFLLIGGSRLLFRSLYFRYARKQSETKQVAIYGAGSSGSQMATLFQHSEEFTAVAFVDDNPLLQNRKLHGIHVFCSADIENLVNNTLNVDIILLAMPSVSKRRKKEILRFLEPLPVEVKSLPPLDELVSGKIELDHIQDIRIEDLLGRDPVPPRLDLLESCIKGKNVLVTGAGGSIGSELCRQILTSDPLSLVLFDHSEFALYTIESELRSRTSDSIKIIPILGSVCDQERLKATIKAFQIQTIYHAAAYKHVPLVEYNTIEGIRNNLFGTLRAAEASSVCNVETFVLISTDKAVRPTNVMGASKRLAELALQAIASRNNNDQTRFTMVRFGNVLGSSGSVVPLFKKQIEDGGPVTVTHPEIMRYFMTIPEAVQLVLQAGAMGKGGDVFVLDMGEPVKIVELARKMIRLSGLTVRDHDTPNGDIAIEFSGLRPGEKLFEELLVGGNVVGTDHPMIMRAEETFLSWERFQALIREMDKACNAFDYRLIREVLINNVDGYSPQCKIVDHVWTSGKTQYALEGGRTAPSSSIQNDNGVITSIRKIKEKVLQIRE